MKRGRSWCLALSVLVAGTLGVLLAAGLYYYVRAVNPRLLAHKRVLLAPPSILVQSPKAGASVVAGGSLSTAAVVTGAQPIARVEIWLDAKLAGTKTPDLAGQTEFYPSFEVPLTEGPHMLYWRAVDGAGLVGQSVPIPIAGVGKPGGTATVIAAGGQSLDEIASARGAEPDEVRELNPSLGGGALPGGTSVTVPVPPSPPEMSGVRVDLWPADASGDESAAAEGFPVPPTGASLLLPAPVRLFDVGSLLPQLLSTLPTAPAHLNAGFENCWIRLMWDDQSANETGFRIWMQRLGGPAQHIQTLEPRAGTGIAWYDFRSPDFGIYSFWVETFNALGAQPSEIRWLAVNKACGAGVATQLEVHVGRLWGFSGGGWGNPYCYLSAEGWPEKRVPEDDNAFLQVDVAGTVDHEVVYVNMPADGVLTLEGDCWSGAGKPASMGTFSVEVPQEQWDGRDLEIRSDNYNIDYRVRPLGSSEPAWGVYSYLDHGIEVPMVAGIEMQHSDDPDEQRLLGFRPTVSWWWSGVAPVTGFSIYVDGLSLGETPLSLIAGGSPKYQASTSFPTSCGGTYQVQVAANVGSARSLLSEPYEYIQPPCGAYADLVVLDYTFSWIRGEDEHSPVCDTAPIETHVVVNELYRGFASRQTTCDIKYDMADLKLAHHRGPVPGLPQQFRVAIDPQNPYVQLKVTWWKPDDEIVGVYDTTIKIPPAELARFRDEGSGGKWAWGGEATVHYMVSTFVAPQ